MITIEDIKNECRVFIAQDAAMEPRCFRGGFTPKAAKALLDLIVDAEDRAIISRRARRQLTELCTLWEESK